MRKRRRHCTSYRGNDCRGFVTSGLERAKWRGIHGCVLPAPLREAADASSTKVLWDEDIFSVSFSKTEWVGYHVGDSKYNPPAVCKFLGKVVGMGGSGGLMVNGEQCGVEDSQGACCPYFEIPASGFPQRKFCPSPTALCRNAGSGHSYRTSYQR